MTLVLSKKERREERAAEKAQKVARDLQRTLLDFRSKIHEMLQEPMGGAIAAFHPPDPSRTPGKRIKPFVRGEVLEPLEPVKFPKGVEKLVIEDVGKEFKEPIVSPKMQKNLRVLELRLDANGFLYSPKKFDPEWNWQTQAIWLRLIGLGYIEISKRLKKSLNTIKSMFKRLNISGYFPRVSKYDWANIGYGKKLGETPSGWRTILMGGSSGILYPSQEMVIDEKSGRTQPLYGAKFSIGETIGFTRDGLLETESFATKISLKHIKPFDFEKHKKELKKREKEAKKRKIEVTTEQKEIEINNLMKHIEEGFDPETGTYHETEMIDDSPYREAGYEI